MRRSPVIARLQEMLISTLYHSYVVSKIAMVDFPSQWPALLPSVLQIMPNGTDAQLHGALRILQDLWKGVCLMSNSSPSPETSSARATRSP